MNPDSAVFLRAIKGPVMLITVGTLFALDNFTGVGFDRTWPVLIIVAGILSLGDRARRIAYNYPQPSAHPAPPPSAQPRPAAPTAEPGSYRSSSYADAPSPSAAASDTRAQEPSVSNFTASSDPGAPR